MNESTVVFTDGAPVTMVAGTQNFRTPELEEFFRKNYYEENRPVEDRQLGYGERYEFYRVTATEDFKITSAPEDSIGETGHFAGFERPASSSEAIEWWALPTQNTARHLWRVIVEPKTHLAVGFVGIPKCGSRIGTALCINFNNAAVRFLGYEHLGLLS